MELLCDYSSIVPVWLQLQWPVMAEFAAGWRVRSKGQSREFTTSRVATKVCMAQKVPGSHPRASPRDEKPASNSDSRKEAGQEKEKELS